MRELPTIASSTYASAAYSPAGGAGFGGNVGTGGGGGGDNGSWAALLSGVEGAGAAPFNAAVNSMVRKVRAERLIGGGHQFFQNLNSDKDEQETTEMAKRRWVQVFVADSNENVPLEQSLLYSGEQKLTDLEDQELFFELDIKQLLEAHNVKRIKIVDKKVKDRTEYLEPAKIRELKMVVVTIASF